MMCLLRVEINEKRNLSILKIKSVMTWVKHFLLFF